MSEPQNKLVQTQCWKCKRVLDATMRPCSPTDKPQTGDVSVCAYCGEIGIFETPTVIREPTKDERLTLLEEAGGDIAELQIVSAGIRPLEE